MQAASVGSLAAALILSDYRVLDKVWREDFACPLHWDELRGTAYLAFQPWAARYPDHVFGAAWEVLCRDQKWRSPALASLGILLGEFFEFGRGQVRARRGLMGAWYQGVVSRVSSAPVLAMADVVWGGGRHVSFGSSRLVDASRQPSSTQWAKEILPLVRPDEPAVRDYIEREGLHEAHLHLNGSTHAEICWLRALRNPRLETRRFLAVWSDARGGARVRELVSQVNPSLTPAVFNQHMRAASRLRAWLVAAAHGDIEKSAQFPASCHDLEAADEDEWSVGIRIPQVSRLDQACVNDEIMWMSLLVDRLQSKPGGRLAQMFHAYLLLSNQYYRLLVQSESQYGFDQFQKLTVTELRDPVERDYLDRFRAMHGTKSLISTVGYLEGRFAPKDSLRENLLLFFRILKGYRDYLCDFAPGARSVHSARTLSGVLVELEDFFSYPKLPQRGVHRLALVAHFIKLPWQSSPRYVAGPCRHYLLSRRLYGIANLLLLSLTRWPRLQHWVRGIDAAANELDAPADVFAPVYRVCARAGLVQRTYHAGEDFRHLLCGIAAIWEALTMLDLRSGDRIGHGTAMGIRPELWLERMPSMLTLPRGEWMLAVLAAWQLLCSVDGAHLQAQRLERELESVGQEIFGRLFQARELEQAMSLRRLNRHDVMRSQLYPEDELDGSLSDYWREESALVTDAVRDNPRSVQLLWEWWGAPDVQARADEMISKSSRYLGSADFVLLQQALMQEVAERGVIIETLPSSNVRISQYHNIDEHHALRWMRVPGHVQEGDPEIMVCLGSDDPGIFAGDLETEFYLLHASLRKEGLTDADALLRLAQLNERGRVYRFHHSLLS